MSNDVAAMLAWAESLPQAWHDSGVLHPIVLRAIAKHAARIGARATAETGSGLSTILLSNIAILHTCFTVTAGTSLQQVQSAPHLKQDRVTFVIGPSQRTLPKHSFPGQLDLALIDGPHAFPFPQLEYFCFYPLIRTGGIVILDDFHIPTIRQTYDILRDDAMWTHLEDVATTAFFQRTDAPLIDPFDPLSGGWETQRFNQRHFPDPSVLDIHVPGWREAMPPAPPAPLFPRAASQAAAPAAPNGTSGQAAEDPVRALEIERLRAENAALRASTSWRVTAPLRSLARAIRGR